VKNLTPSRNQRMRAGAIKFHSVCVKAGLTFVARALATADPTRLVAQAAWIRAAVERGELRAESVDILHDVDLSDSRPVRSRGG
jgi:hypothetical protein